MVILLLIPNYFISKKRNYGKTHPFSLSNLWTQTKKSWTALLAPLLIMGVILTGITTPTEAAGITVLYVLIVDGLFYRVLSLKDIWESIKKTASLTSAILLIASASALMNFIIAFENIPQVLSATLSAVPGGKFGFFIFFFIMVIIIGCVLDATPATLIFCPLFLPAAVHLGIDPIHFILLWVMGVALGMTTPGYGVCVFCVAAITRVPIGAMVREAIPYYLVTILAMVLIAIFPQIVLIIPQVLNL